MKITITDLIIRLKQLPLDAEVQLVTVKNEAKTADDVFSSPLAGVSYVEEHNKVVFSNYNKDEDRAFFYVASEQNFKLWSQQISDN